MPEKVKQETCNFELRKLVAAKTGESTADIKSAVDFVNTFIEKTITEGAFETVMLPRFGKFKPKTKFVQRVFDNKGLPKDVIITPRIKMPKNG